MSDARKRFEDLLDDFSDAMLTTIGGDGRPYARPMRVARITDGSDLWFVTSKKKAQILERLTEPDRVVTFRVSWSQNAMRLSWSHEQVDERLQPIMKEIHERCVEFGERDDRFNYFDGANIAGFKKVADAFLSYGVV